MTISVHAIQTGRVRVRQAQRRRGTGGPLHTLIDPVWTEWLPIYCWAVEHPEGLIVVDTGETARTADPGYLPAWHPYYRRAVRFDVNGDHEVGPALRRHGLDPADVRTVVLTHLHTDHAGGLHHFPHATILADADEIARARGVMGRLRGYLPHRWPEWFAPESIAWRDEPVGPFKRSASLTADGAVVAVPTPGHTPNHLSVIVRTSDVSYFLAGDVSYDEQAVVEDVPDGVGPDPSISRATLAKVRALAASEPLVYLPSHDAEAEERLQAAQVLGPS